MLTSLARADRRNAVRAVLCGASVVAILTADAAACASPPAQDNAMVLTDSDNNKEVVLSSKETLTLKLEAQLGTGYGWDIAEVDKDRLEPAGAPTIERVTKEGVGGRELQVFVFKPVKPGKAVLKMRYVRPWEKTAKPQKTFSVTVTIT
jgi:predicted secreted protein